MRDNNEKFHPLVSIIIPVYNGSSFLREAIDSALAQTYDNIEVVVVNDGSNDEGKTDRIAKSYGNKISYFVKENGGVSTALNLGIKKMRGEYFSWLSHDDKYTSDKIQKQIDAIAKFGDGKVVCLGESRKIDVNGEIIHEKCKKRFSERIVNWSDVLMSLLNQGTFNGCALLIPKFVFEKCGEFSEDLRFNQDSFMWMKICLQKIDFLYIKDVVAFMRIHSGQLTQRGQDIFHADCEKISVFLQPTFLGMSTRQQNFLYAYAKYNAKYNNPKIVKSCIKDGKKRKILSWTSIMKLRILMLYGKIRPQLRKFYYWLFRKVKVK